MSGWQHDALAHDLAQHLRCDRRIVWTDMQLGPSGSPRPDVYTLERSYSRPLPTAYECKISRSDLRSDITSGKWQKYLDYAGAVIFAVPDGLCKPDEIPTGCGLIVRKAQTWRNVRKATRQPLALPMDACMKLLLDGVSRTVAARACAPRKADLWTECAAVRKKYGAAVAAAARDLAAAESRAADMETARRTEYERVKREVATHREHMMDRARREVAEYEGVKGEVVEWLGLGADATLHAVRRRLTELRAACDADARVADAETRLTRARNGVEGALKVLAPAETEAIAPLFAILSNERRAG